MEFKVLSSAALEGLTPQRLMDEITRVQRCLNRLNVYHQRLIAVAEKTAAARSAGHANTAEALARSAGISIQQARRVARRAREIDEQPTVAEALAAGHIGIEQAHDIAVAVVSDPVREQLLACAAVGEDADTTKKRVARAEIDASAETGSQRFMRQHRSRFARMWRNRRGMTRIEAELAPDAGAQVHATLEAVSSAMLRLDRQLPREERRNADQRCADALTQAITSSGDARTSACGGRFVPQDHTNTYPAGDRHTTNYTTIHQHANDTSHQHASTDGAIIDQRTGEILNREPERHAKEASKASSSTDESGHLPSMTERQADETGQADGSASRRHCECETAAPSIDGRSRRDVPLLRITASLEALRRQLDESGITDTGEEIAPETLRRIACDAEILPAIMDSKGHVVNSGRATRQISNRLRQELVIRDGGCVWPGCDALVTRTQGHHREHWADGGPTTLDNLNLFCWPHHILVHEGQYRIDSDDHQGWVIYRPDGSILTRTPRDVNLRSASNGNTKAQPSRGQRPVGDINALQDAERHGPKRNIGGGMSAFSTQPAIRVALHPEAAPDTSQPSDRTRTTGACRHHSSASNERACSSPACVRLTWRHTTHVPPTAPRTAEATSGIQSDAHRRPLLC